MSRVFVVGIGCTPFRKPGSDVNYVALGVEAGKQALADAGLEPSDVSVATVLPPVLHYKLMRRSTGGLLLRRNYCWASGGWRDRMSSGHSCDPHQQQLFHRSNGWLDCHATTSCTATPRLAALALLRWLTTIVGGAAMPDCTATATVDCTSTCYHCHRALSCAGCHLSLAWWCRLFGVVCGEANATDRHLPVRPCGWL